MELVFEQASLQESIADCVLVGVFSKQVLSPAYNGLDSALGGALKEALKGFKAEPGKAKLLTTLGRVKPKAVILAGLGGEESLEALRKATGAAVKEAKRQGFKSARLSIHSSFKDEETAAKAECEAAVLSLYSFDKFKSDKEDLFEKIVFEESVKAAAEKGKLLGDGANYARDLVNLPGNVVTPSYLAAEAEKLGSELGFKVKVLDEGDAEKLGMNCFLAVAKGSDEPARFVVLEKEGEGDPLVLVGKGVTFDTGGLNIKVNNYMTDMKMDMAGAAAVLGAFKAAAALGLKKRLVGLLPCCENMPSGRAQRPGDIVKAYNGKTVEVLNTDAEGRMILADALAYAEKHYKPWAIIDLATLTGAVIVALGYAAAGFFTNDSALARLLKKASENSGERVWELPLYEEYKDWVKSDNADVRNISKAPHGYEAGSCTGAAFLSNFVKGRWAHVDIAGTAFSYEQHPYLGKGATGYGVRLLTAFLESL